MSRTTILQKATTPEELSAKLCNHTNLVSDSVPSTANLVVTGSHDMDLAVGVSLNGVLIYAGLNESDYDTFYPVQKETPVEHVDRPDLDACLGIVDSSTLAYHYYSLSPCLLQNAA